MAKEAWKKNLPDYLREAGEKPYLKMDNKRVKKLLEQNWRLDVYQAIQDGKPIPLEVFDTLTTEEKRVLFFQSYKEVDKK